MTGPDRLLERIQRAAGVPDLLESLTTRLAPTDLQSLLLAVYRQLAARVTPARLLERYRQDRFAAPAGLDPRRVAAFEAASFSGRGLTPLTRPRVAVTDLRGGELGPVLEAQVLAPLAARFPGATLHLDPTRESGRRYYRDVCFKIYGTDAAGQEWDVADGGMTDWTQKLLASRKERLLIGGVGVERLLLRG